ncbi:MAG TPA: hypothetical protein VM285_07325 [Polyangia bacterium]|nr:hypothetical protein [Polyangia bacterium]
MRAAIVGLAAVFAAAGVACSSDGGAGAGAPPDSGDAAEVASATVPDDYQMTRIVDLGEGSHAVFGLRIPRGMRPTSGPHKVYRFEGTLDVIAARRFVMRQVETVLLKDEPTGYLIRGARVLFPVGEVDPQIRLAIRIFRGRKGGATVDVWVERDRERERSRTAAGGGGAGGAAGSEAARIEPGSPEARRRVEERQKAFELLEKIGRGEPLSPEDADNPFFQ